ncbi:hypothetical protein, partial [Streptomyces sp. FH025]|uniref:hypothetical protein n=1 Tax=Streptomyces sp. FH025 TaxID=2815937 RepID=UPI001A9FFCEE
TLSTVLWTAPASGSSTADRPPSVDQTTASPRTKAYQVTAWWMHGGEELTTRFTTLATEFGAFLTNGDGEVEESAVKPYCDRINTLAADTTAYFRIPETQAQSEWQQYLTHLTQSGHDCDTAVHGHDGDHLVSSLQQLATAATHIKDATQRITDLGTAGGLDKLPGK